MKTALFIGTTLMSQTFALADPVAEHRNLASVWGGTVPTTACKFKALSTLFPTAKDTIIEQSQTETWAGYSNAEKQMTEDKIAYGTYVRRLKDGSILKQAAANHDKKDSTNPVGYYYFTWTDGKWKKVVSTVSDTNTEVLVQPSSSGSSFGEEQYRFRGTTNQGNAEFTAETTSTSGTGSRSNYTDTKITAYGASEQIAKSDLVFGAASVCTRRGSETTADTDTDADSDDIFVWATYTFPAFDYQVDKTDDSFDAIMGANEYDDDNNEVVFVYGNQPQNTPVTSQSFTTISLSANSVNAKCTTAIKWADAYNTASDTHPEKCWITGTHDETGDPDDVHTVKEGCKAGADMSCELYLASNTNTQPTDSDYDVLSSVAVLQFVKLYTSTIQFPYSNYESFLDDAPTSGFGTGSWYYALDATDTDPFTVLGAKSTSTTFTCDTTTYSSSKVDCRVGDKTTGTTPQTGLGITPAALVSTWPTTADAVYPTVYVSMIAQVEFLGDVAGRASNADGSDSNGSTITSSDSDVSGGTIETLQTALVNLQSVLADAQTAYNAAKDALDAADADLAVKITANDDAQAEKAQCELTDPTGASCTTEEAAATSTSNAKDAAITTQSAKSQLETTKSTELATASSAVDAKKTEIQQARVIAHPTSTRRMLVHKPETVLKKTIITGQHFGKHHQIN